MYQSWRVGLALFLVAVAGCGGGDEGPETVAVTGEVTFAGEPVPSGEIIFRPADGSGRADAGRIEAGKFSFESTLGQKSVSITALRDVAGVVPQQMETGESGGAVEQYIPEIYNGKTTLTADVTSSGDNAFSFALESE